MLTDKYVMHAILYTVQFHHQTTVPKTGELAESTQVKKYPEISDFLQGIPPCFRQVSHWYYTLKRETLQIIELNQLIR